MDCKWSQEHISIDQYGKFRPCCGWQGHTNEDPHLNFQDHSIQQYLDSDFKKNINNRLAQNQWPGGCHKCMVTENNQTISLRTERVRLIRDMEIKFGNLCNLGCYMCTADKSSLLHKTYSDMIQAGLGDNRIQDEVEHHEKRQNKISVAWYDNPDKIVELAQYAATRERIRFTGGEPTVNTYLKHFLEELCIHNTNIILRITTNGMSLSDALLRLLSKFKQVQLTYSIDGTGVHNEYMRYPSNWNKIQTNYNKAKTLPNVVFDINTVVSFLNVHLLNPVIEWGLNNGAIKHTFLPVHEPKMLHPGLSYNWQKDIFNETVNRFKDHKHIELHKCNAFVNKEQTDLTDTFSLLDRLDTHRNTDWRTTFGIET